jgi:mono/diheme cytochrome c family protein
MVLDRCKKLLAKGTVLGAALLMAAVVMPGNVSAQEANAAMMDGSSAVEPGDATIGKKLFTGEIRFSNGGPACVSCHTAGNMPLGGGTLGPELTNTYADPSKQPLLSTVWVNIPDIPVMGPIFSAKNITEDEMGNLRAYFEQTSISGQGGAKTGVFAIIGIGGFIGILIVFNIIWAGRYRNRVKGTAHDALWRNYGGKGGR